MKKIALLLFLFTAAQMAGAQKIDSIYFHLYTDSLKKGFFNYINVDGKTAEGQWVPLTAEELTFSANTGYFKNNDLFIDSSYTGEKVTIKAVLKSNPRIWKEVTIYIRKRGFDEPLKTDEELLNDWKRRSKKQKLTAF